MSGPKMFQTKYYKYAHSGPSGDGLYLPHGYFHILPIRAGKYDGAANQAIDDMKNEWSKALGRSSNSKADFKCTFSSFGNYVTWAFPEVPPKRVGTAAQIGEFAFYWDDATDAIDMKTNHEISNDLVLTIKSVTDGRVHHKPIYPINSSVLRLLHDSIAVDDVNASIGMIKSWTTHVQNQQTSSHNDMDFDKALEHRLFEGATRWAIEFGIWNWGLAVNDVDKDSVEHIIIHGLQAAILMNDYYSFNKEFDACKAAGTLDRLQNTLSTLMREYGYSETEARDILRKKIVHEESALLKGYEDWKQQDEIRNAVEIEKLILMVIFMTSGSAYWTATSLRYNRPLATTEKDRAWLVGKSHHGLRVLNDYPPPASIQSGWSKETVRANSSLRSGGSRHPRSKFYSLAPSSSKSSTVDFKRKFHDAPDHLVLAPYNYIDSLPSKKIRDRFADSLNHWLGAPDTSLGIIKGLVNTLHTSSLMLDDIEDGSTRRRGQPPAYALYGISQTINSANYVFASNFGVYFSYFHNMEKLKYPMSCETKYLEQVQNLFRGQSLDLNWRFNAKCPTEDEYITMIDNKTGSLFTLIAKMITEESDVESQDEIYTFTTLLGRYFQILDDWKNLTSKTYAETKTFAEDLNEGKFSLPLIHVLSNAPSEVVTQIRGAIFGRPDPGQKSADLTPELKLYIVEHMKKAGSLDYVRGVLEDLYKDILGRLDRLEASLGQNLGLRVLVVAMAPGDE